MKTILLSSILSFFFLSNGDSEKKVEETIKIGQGKILNLNFQFADEINVSTWDKQEVYVLATVNINDNEDNDKFELKVEQANGGVSIESVIKNMNENKDKKECNTFSSDLNFEVKIPNNISLKLSTISGDIILKSFDKEMDINTISGFVDVTFPAETKANLKASTISGELFTNHQLEMKSDDNSHFKVGEKIDVEMNGGGVDIDLKTISGNVYIRK